MIDVRCGDSVGCGDSRGGAVVCTLTVTGREYARLVAIADTLNALANETPNYGCKADNTPATVFAGFFVDCPGELRERAVDLAWFVSDGGWGDDVGKAVSARLSEALKRADDA